MIVSVTKDWRIEVDRNNFTLQRRSVGQEKGSKNYGQEVWGTQGYYSTPGGALFAIVRAEAVKPDTLVLMKEMIEVYRDLGVRFDQRGIREACDQALKAILTATAVVEAPAKEAVAVAIAVGEKTRPKQPESEPPPVTKKIRKPSRRA